MSRLVLLRHADIDTDSRLCGCLDVPLSDRGRRQVAAAAARARSWRAPQALYTSPLTRAREVAARLGQTWDIEPRVVPALREIQCGSFEGMRLEQLRLRYPDVWARHLAQSDDDFAWPGGESYRAFRARILAACAEIASLHRHERVMLVTHAGVISQVVGVIRGRPAAVWNADRPEPLTATEVAWANGVPEAVVRYNDAEWY